MIKSKDFIKIELGNSLPKALGRIAARVEMAMEMMTWTIKTGKPGRPKKMFTKADLLKMLDFKD